VQALAAAAGVAIENARLYEQTHRRERWLEASHEIHAALLSGMDADDAVRLVAVRARELTGADCTALALPDPLAPKERLVVTVGDGAGADALTGGTTPLDDSLAGQVLRTGTAQTVLDVAAAEPLFAAAPGYGPALFAPLGGADGAGVLIAANRTGGDAFGADAVESAAAFALHAALALQLAEARRAQQRLELYADRDRIARDLHDQVIQRLFATGMTLESLVRQVPATVAPKLHRAVDDLDRSIRDIRGTIYALQTPPDAPPAVRQRLAVVAEEAVGQSGLVLDLRTSGPLDTTVPADVVDHATAVLREAVTNVVKHARATRVWVSVAVDDRLRIEVSDDGTGMPAGVPRSGLTNLADRATRLGGTCTVDRQPDGAGTRVAWDVPLD
jgi:signal transduction histidine kinase